MTHILKEAHMINNCEADIIHIEACNFIDTPLGGQLNFSRQLIRVFGSRMALVGLTDSPSDPLGRWFKKELNNTEFLFFAIGRSKKTTKRPLIPARITTLLRIKKFQNRIFTIGINNIILSEHSVLLALNKKHNLNICFRFPGVDSPLSISRYPWAKMLSRIFDKFFYNALASKAGTILAAADESAISKLKSNAGFQLKTIVSFPTRTDTSEFCPGDSVKERKRLAIPVNTTVITTSGRIHWAKGWDFLLDSFKKFSESVPDACLVFIGDGCDKEKLKCRASGIGISDKIILPGHLPPETVASYLRASDLFIMGSLKEGWSTVLVEAIACHLPVVTTKFSSADTLVQNGINGFTVNRVPAEFAEKMKSALTLKGVCDYSEKTIPDYALYNLKHDLLNKWKLN
jgi:glycosyltransferase involved in cell wall biosynthesis